MLTDSAAGALPQKPENRDISFTPGFSPVSNGDKKRETVLTVSSSGDNSEAVEYVGFCTAITYLPHHPVFSPRSGRQHKAWGVSPRSSPKMSIEPAKRVTAVALQIHSNEAAAAHFAGFIALPGAILGLTPQALC